DDSEDSTIDFPVKVNVLPVKHLSIDADDVLYHYGNTCEPIPVYSVDEKPLDGPSTLTNTLKCPVQYISKIPPSMVSDNFCFICDGDEVSVEEILSECQWWKQTSSSTRFYSSDNLTTFHQVTLLTCRGETRGAYRSRVQGGAIAKVSLDKKERETMNSKSGYSYSTSGDQKNLMIALWFPRSTWIFEHPLQNHGTVLCHRPHQQFLEALIHGRKHGQHKKVATHLETFSPVCLGRDPQFHTSSTPSPIHLNLLDRFVDVRA
ncbi:hypothetical protein GCK32_006567, partial [Trichostrongylus colubriformis]